MMLWVFLVFCTHVLWQMCMVQRSLVSWGRYDSFGVYSLTFLFFHVVENFSVSFWYVVRKISNTFFWLVYVRSIWVGGIVRMNECRDEPTNYLEHTYAFIHSLRAKLYFR